MFHSPSVTLLSLICAAAALAADPAAAISAAREAISARDYERAIAVLRASIPEAKAIADPKQHDDALAALHFYTAMALSANGSPDQAREELRQFMQFHPGRSNLDSRKYPAAFVKLFNDVMGEPAAVEPQAFERY